MQIPKPVVLVVLYFSLSQGYNWTQTVRSYAGKPASYPTKGIPCAWSLASCTPGGRRDSVVSFWDGNVYMFGGFGKGPGNSSSSFFNDMWTYSPSSNNWTWISGSGAGNASGNWGQKGVPSTNNVPSSRFGSTGFNTPGYMFGGIDYNYLVLSDMWTYNYTANIWTWISGSNITGKNTTWGTLGQQSTSNHPGGRYYTNSWYNGSTFFIFGGCGGDPTLAWSDFWIYSTAAGWGWYGGAQVFTDPGNYTSCGSSCFPAGRYSGVTWIVGTTLYMFGGMVGSTMFDDLWQYNPSNNVWTLISGIGQANTSAVYPSAPGTTSMQSFPGARSNSVAWSIGEVFYLYAGRPNLRDGFFDDIWAYCSTSSAWFWIGGNGLNQTGSASTPGARYSASLAMDTTTNMVWVFSGFGFGESGNVGLLSDLWALGNYSANCPPSGTTSIVTTPLTTTGPFITAPRSSSTSSSIPGSTVQAPPQGGKLIGIIVGVVGGVIVLSVIVIVLYLVKKRRNNAPSEQNGEANSVPMLPTQKVIKDVVIKELLGSGNYGEVYRGTWGGSDVALKRLKNSENLGQLEKELVTLASLTHPNIVQYYGTFQDSSNVQYIVTELCAGNALATVQTENLSILDKLTMAHDAACGMVYLSSMNIIHADLGLRNVLVSKVHNKSDAKYCVKIADFGLSKQLENSEYYSSKNAELPIRWTAPEALEYGRLSVASDVWSFGVLLWELFTNGKKLL